MTQYSYRIGTTLGGLTNVESLTVPLPPPRSTYTPYSEQIDLGDGTIRGAGWAQASWNWGFLTQAQRDQLRTFCPGASASVYISTRTTDSADVYDDFTAVMIWPQAEERDSKQVRPDFTVQFRKLVAA